MHTPDGGETWNEQEKTLMEGSEIFDVLDLPTFFGVHIIERARGHRRRPRRPDRPHRRRRRDLDVRDDRRVDVPLVDPLFSRSSSPTAPAGRSAPPAR